jgi:long-chain fatty aldehyde decarbonylase
MAAMNYRALSTICDDPAEVADALEHAQGEQGHAAAFTAEGRKIGVDVPSNVDARYWKRIRESFMRSIAERDFMACLIIQEIMLESFAVANYTGVGKSAPGSLGRTFSEIAQEEEGHIDHADMLAVLRGTGRARLPDDEIREVFPWIPPRPVCRVEIASTTGARARGLYIDSFIPPDRLDGDSMHDNISRERAAAACAINAGAKIVSLGGFSSILIEGNFNLLPERHETVFTRAGRFGYSDLKEAAPTEAYVLCIGLNGC